MTPINATNSTPMLPNHHHDVKNCMDLVPFPRESIE